MKPSPLDRAIAALKAAREASYAMEASMKGLKPENYPGLDLARLWNKPNSSGFSAHDQMAQLAILKAAKKA